MTNIFRHILIGCAILAAPLSACAAMPAAAPQQSATAMHYDSFRPGKLWLDTDGRVINAHGGGILFHDGRYWWYGEHKGWRTNNAQVGINCYSSSDLYNWRYEGVVLPVSDNPQSPLAADCIMERPKVIYCRKTGQFVMYFHLELKGRGYEAAHVAVAVSDSPAGPFRLVKHGRVNAGKAPLGTTVKQLRKDCGGHYDQPWWTAEWRDAIVKGLFTVRDMEGGQMSRDMTLFVDDDGTAYHIYSSEDNLTLQIAELTPDYLGYTGRYIRIDPAGHNEAPAVFKKDGRYFMITSGCTGWEPNAARLLTADSMLGTWTRHGNPCRGEGADLTFRSQSTYIMPVPGKADSFIFMADRWQPSDPIDGRYVWLPIDFEDGIPVIRWRDNWRY